MLLPCLQFIYLTVHITACQAVSEPRHTLPDSLLGFSTDETSRVFAELASLSSSHPLGPTEDHKHDTLLVNFYFRLHRLLYASRKIPVSGWGRAHADQKTVMSTTDLTKMPELTRASINKFWMMHADSIPDGSKCLEFWPLYYIPLTHRCAEKWGLHFETEPSKWRVDEDNKAIYVDLSAPGSHKVLPKGAFDVMVTTQALQYPRSSRKTVLAWASMLRQGGHMLLTAPFIERTDGAYPDRYRFTRLGAESIIESAGLAIRQQYIGGTGALSTAFLMGFSSTDISEAERDAHLLVNITMNAVDERLPPVYYGVYMVLEKVREVSYERRRDSKRLSKRKRRALRHV